MQDPLILNLLVLFWTAFGASFLTWLGHRAAGFHFLPAPVRKLLADATRRTQIVDAITDVARFANLTPEDRRTESLRRVGLLLENHGVTLSESELNLLIETGYAWVKQHRRAALVAPPLHWGRPQ